MKLDKQKSNLKYYYQTQDYKIHAYKNIPEFLDKSVSKIALQKFFDFQDPKELKDLFDSESSRMLNSQKTKVRMSK